MADKPRHLLSGYAAGILDNDERRELMEAAVTDQEVFDHLVEEESWRRIFGIPSVRREILAALDEPSLVQRLLGMFRPPAARWAVGAMAAAVLALVLVPGWQGPGVTTPADGDLTAKSAKSGDSVSKIPPLSDLRSFSYGLELLNAQGATPISANHQFAPEDEFRIRLEVDFPAWVYLLNRTEGDDEYTVIYPQTPEERASRQGEILLPSSQMDAFVVGPSPEDERLVLVVTTAPWSLVQPERTAIPHQELDEALSRIESDLRTVSWSRFVEADRVHLKIADPRGELFFVERLLAE